MYVSSLLPHVACVLSDSSFLSPTDNVNILIVTNDDAFPFTASQRLIMFKYNRVFLPYK